MGVVIKTKSQTEFFEKLFGSESQPITMSAVYDLASKGVFSFSLYGIDYKPTDWIGEPQMGVHLNSSINSLMKGNVSPAEVKIAQTTVRNWVFKTSTTMNKVTVDTPELPKVLLSYKFMLAPNPATPQHTVGAVIFLRELYSVGSMSLADAKALVYGKVYLQTSSADFLSKMNEAVSQYGYKTLSFDIVVNASGSPNTNISCLWEGDAELIWLNNVGAGYGKSFEGALGATHHLAQESINKMPPPVDNKPLPSKSSTIALKSASALGQPVQGTSKGSVYHVIALNERVKVAAKINKAHSISFRIEIDGAPTSDEAKKIMQGVHWNSALHYGSRHLAAGNVPVARVVGAFLMGLGIKFDQQVLHEGDLVIQ